MPTLTTLGVALVTLAVLFSLGSPAMAGEQWNVYLGTYTGPKSKGIYLTRLDLASGQLAPPQLAGEVTNPSFLAIHPTGRYLFCVGEVANIGGKKGGAVTAFSIDPSTGQLTQINQQSSVGTGPCHISLNSSGTCALVANYGGGSVAALPIAPDGRLSEASCFIQHEGKSVNPKRQAAPHAHSINLDAANRFAFVADLGLDKVMIYRFDAEKGKLTANDPPFAQVAGGAGPRHFSFHPTGKYAYVINEMGMTVTAFAYDAARGALSEIQTITTLPAGEGPQAAYSTAEVQVHPFGKFLYGSNRGHDTIAAFAINPSTGKLTPVGHTPSGGKLPRNFGIDPTGQYLLAAHQASDNVVVFKIDQTSGKLTPTGSQIEVGAPVCVKFLKK